MKRISVVILLIVLLVTNSVTLLGYLDTHNRLQIANQQFLLDQKLITELDGAYRQSHDEIEAWRDWAERTVGYCPSADELAK